VLLKHVDVRLERGVLVIYDTLSNGSARRRASLTLDLPPLDFFRLSGNVV
jgi:hypothetical protein